MFKIYSIVFQYNLIEIIDYLPFVKGSIYDKDDLMLQLLPVNY